MITSNPAFPCPDGGQEDYGTKGAYRGLDMRDYFAAQAMQGILAGVHPIVKDEDPLTKVADAAYQMAEAMLKRRTA